MSDFVIEWLSDGMVSLAEAEGDLPFEVYIQPELSISEIVTVDTFEIDGAPILVQGGISRADLNEHVNSETPHPVYDDGPSLALLYENAKV
jgi:hypothetical protein